MRVAVSLVLLLASMIGLLSGSSIARAAELTVTSTADEVDAAPGDGVCATAGGECTLRAAIQQANALLGPDTISIPAGTYVLSIAGADESEGASGDLDVHEAVTIVGAGQRATILDGARLDRVLDVGTGATDPIAVSIRDLRIQNGLAPDNSDGGGLVVGRGDVLLAAVVFRHNEATSNGGGLATGTIGSLTIRYYLFLDNVASNTQVLDNSASHAGGIRLNDASLTIESSTVARNTANGTGGIGIFRSGDLIATNVTISDNASGTTGVDAGISVPGEASVLTHVTIADNRVGFGIGQNNNTITLRHSIVDQQRSAGLCPSAPDGDSRRVESRLGWHVRRRADGRSGARLARLLGRTRGDVDARSGESQSRDRRSAELSRQCRRAWGDPPTRGGLRPGCVRGEPGGAAGGRLPQWILHSRVVRGRHLATGGLRRPARINSKASGPGMRRASAFSRGSRLYRML